MDEVNIVGLCNLDYLVTSQVSTDRGVLSALANDIGFVGLLPVHGQAVLITEDGDGLQRQLVRGTEDSNGDLSTVGN